VEITSPGLGDFLTPGEGKGTNCLQMNAVN
jgi:hypothetical protein